MLIKAVFVAFGLLIALPLYADEVRSLTFCEDPWPPYTFGEVGEAPVGGYAVEFLNEISTRTGITIEMQLLPWKRCLILAEQGLVDGVMLLTRNKDRERYLTFTYPLKSDQNLVWFKKSRKQKTEWRTFADLKPYRIGLTAGFNYGDAFARARQEHKLMTEDALDIKANFEKLMLDRIDIFLVNLAAANAALIDFPDLRQQVTYSDALFEEVPFSIGLSKKTSAMKYLETFNTTINSMLEDGTINRILAD